MISWIQKTFQRHFRLVFLLVLAAMAIPLIVIFTPSSGIGQGGRRVAERRVFGYNLASQEDSSRLFGDAGLSAQLEAGYSPEGSELQNYALTRAAALQLADELHLPAATKQEITDSIKAMRAFAGPDGQFDAQRYALFRDSLKTNPRMTEARVSQVLSDDVRVGKIQKLLAGPGYVLASEVKSQLERGGTSWTLGVATVDYASFNPTILVNDAILAKFFGENSFRYEIAPRAVVSYAEFSILPLISTVAVTEPEIRAYYDANPAQFPKPAADPKAAANPAAAYAAVHAQVETKLRVERARQLATKAASDLSYALYRQNLTPGTPAFEAFIAAQKITLKSLAPFTLEAGPVEFGGSPDIAKEAFKLGKDRSYSDAVNTPAGAVVLFWKETLPARQPLLAEVHAKVAADYTEGEKRKRFVDLGRAVRAAIEAHLKAGETFDRAVAEAAGADAVKITAKMFPAFTRRQPPKDLDYSVLGTLDRLEKGRVSDMIMARDHGLFVYAADQKLPDLGESTPEFLAARAQIAMVTARDDAGAYINALVADELKKSEPAPEK